jgi:hypothetical protein
MMWALETPSWEQPVLTIILAAFAIIGSIATIVCAVAGVVTICRTPKLPDPPYEPSVLFFEGIDMRGNVRDLLGHSRAAIGSLRR